MNLSSEALERQAKQIFDVAAERVVVAMLADMNYISNHPPGEKYVFAKLGNGQYEVSATKKIFTHTKIIRHDIVFASRDGKFTRTISLSQPYTTSNAFDAAMQNSGKFSLVEDTRTVSWQQESGLVVLEDKHNFSLKRRAQEVDTGQAQELVIQEPFSCSVLIRFTDGKYLDIYQDSHSTPGTPVMVEDLDPARRYLSGIAILERKANEFERKLYKLATSGILGKKDVTLGNILN